MRAHEGEDALQQRAAELESESVLLLRDVPSALKRRWLRLLLPLEEAHDFASLAGVVTARATVPEGEKGGGGKGDRGRNPRRADTRG